MGKFESTLCQTGTQSLVRSNRVEGGSKQTGSSHDGEKGETERAVPSFLLPALRDGRAPFVGVKGVFHLAASTAPGLHFLFF